MELLERIVREDDRVGLVGDLQDERVTPSDGPSRWRHQFAGQHGRFVLGPLGGVDAVPEGGIDDDGELIGGMLGQKGSDGFVELAEAGEGTTFGRDVRAVYDDVLGSHAVLVNRSVLVEPQRRPDRSARHTA